MSLTHVQFYSILGNADGYSVLCNHHECDWRYNANNADGLDLDNVLILTLAHEERAHQSTPVHDAITDAFRDAPFGFNA